MIRTDSLSVEWVSRAKSVSIEDAASLVGAVLKPPNAVERCGPCPMCGGTDRFSINTRKQVFNCRGTKGGDSIDLVMHARGCSFLEACEFLTGEERPEKIAATSGWTASLSYGLAMSGGREVIPDYRRSSEPSSGGAIPDPKQPSCRARDAQGLGAVAAPAPPDPIRQGIDRILMLMSPVEGTHAEAYLRARELALGPWCERLGFLSDAPYRDDSGAILARVPCLIAPIIHAPTGEAIGLHRTYLDPDKPAKFKAPNGGGAKRVYGQLGGGIIPLGPIGETLAVGEGIETTVAWFQHPDLGGEIDGVTIAAAISLGNMSGGCTGTIAHPTKVNERTGKSIRVPNGLPDMERPGMVLPPQVKRLILLGDGDSDPLVTRASVLAAARRHRAQGIDVSIQFAPVGHDFASLAA